MSEKRSVKESSRKIRDVATTVKTDLKAVVQDISNSLPRPLAERRTMILKEPLIKRFQRLLRRE